MTQKNIVVLVSADYELFHGRNFQSADDVLFGPTQKMFDVCAEHQVPITLFADICSVWAARKFGLNDFASRFESQLLESAKLGHDVQLHIHPHWLVSKYEGGQWALYDYKIHLSEFGFSPSGNGGRKHSHSGK